MSSMGTFSWDEICKRAKEHNKTILCEVEKKGKYRFYLLKCLTCGNEKVQKITNFPGCKFCNIIKQTSNKEEFILKARKLHGEKYNYDLVEYFHSNIEVKIFCINCQRVFEQKPQKHLSGTGCRTCGYKTANDKKRCSQEEFISKAKKLHGEDYNYDFVDYKSAHVKIKIKCNICDEIFEQEPNSHLKGQGCKPCSITKLSLGTEEFIRKAEIIHGNKFNYDLLEYKNSYTKIKIICVDCNCVFEQMPHHHLKLRRLPSCCIKRKFIENAKKIHGAKYNYDLMEYEGNKIKIKIFCIKCEKIFLQRPNCHLNGSGCPFCNESKGEYTIAKYLNKCNIDYIRQHIFEGLYFIKHLKLDFYIPEYNLIIEYDGEGHFRAVFGSTPEEKQKNLEVCQIRDKVKDDWAKANNIPLLRISYLDFDRIEEIVEAFIAENTKKQIELEI